jgi:exodeoxyribonuclease V alpha subunit
VTIDDRFPSVPPELEPFVRATVLTPGQARTAALLSVTAGETRPEVLLAVALAVRAPTTGSVCVELSQVAEQVVPAAEEIPDAVGSDVSEPRALGGTEETGDVVRLDELRWPDPTAWAGLVADSPLAASIPGVVAPVVVEGDRVYLHRHWVLEEFVAADLRNRSRPGAGGAVVVGAEDVESMFGAASRARGGDEVDPRQRQAALAASDSRLVVVSGGPGTGKTTTIATLLAALVRASVREGVALRVRLVAPTGKAASRMTEAIRGSLDLLRSELTDEERTVLEGLEATTIHRLLGRGRHGGFDHGPGNPVAVDVVVVDEVSMVSLALMAGLLAAVPPDATLLLVGDPDQLASVEAGSVLGDLLGRGPGTGGRGAPPTVLAGNAVELETPHRTEDDVEILELADLIRSGEADQVVAALSGGLEGVEWIDPDRAGGPDGVARIRSLLLENAEALIAGARAFRGDPLVDPVALRELFGKLNHVKVLAALRRGPTGVDQWNRTVEDHLRRRGLVGYGDWYSGRPVMVLRNDYLNGVFNGDVGVAVRDTTGDHHDVWFPREPTPQRVPSARLADYTTQWAMSIHKSQGSEFDHVVVTLPPPPSRILTRELLYTAVTRAKSRVTIVATEAAIREAVTRPAARASGLTERLS